MLNDIFMISLSISAVILLLLLISPLLNNRYSAKWRYFVWLILALRLIIPFRLELPDAPVNIPVPQNQAIAFKQEGIPVTIIDDRDIAEGNVSHASAEYAPVITLQALLFIVWGIGAISFILYHIAGYIIFKRKSGPYYGEADTKVLGNVLNSVKVRGRPKLFICDKITSPMMIGFFRAVILLPATNYTDEELSVVLIHELTHYKRGDIWYKLLLIVANSLHWFNPFVYLMVKQANRDLEYSCDDAVIKNTDMDFRKHYSLTILKSMQKSETTTLSTYLNGGGSNE